MRFCVGHVATAACVEAVAEIVIQREAADAGGSLVPVTGPVPRSDGSDFDVMTLLVAVRDADPACGLDSAVLAQHLEWPAAVVAERLTEAKAQLLVWAIRVGGSPGPCFADIELTVQGRRLLRTVDIATPRA